MGIHVRSLGMWAPLHPTVKESEELNYFLGTEAQQTLLDPISVNILDWAEKYVGRTVRSKDKAQPVGPGFSTKIPPAKRIRKLVNDNLGLSLNGLRRTRNTTPAHKARGSLEN